MSKQDRVDIYSLLLRGDFYKRMMHRLRAEIVIPCYAHDGNNTVDGHVSLHECGDDICRGRITVLASGDGALDTLEMIC